MIHDISEYRPILEGLYADLNRREFVHPDPLEFVHLYDDPRDQEIVGLVASSLAYGRVAQILKSVANVISRVGGPARFVTNASKRDMVAALDGFKHRFTTGRDMADMLFGAGRVIARHGSLEACFAQALEDSHEDVVPALSHFACEIAGESGACRGYLLPRPEAGSACKRLNLYLRWMVRADAVDIGAWKGVPASKLIVPLDTHMHRIGRSLGLTDRKQADLRAALEITAAFRSVSPEDPVKYDFALTRLGIRDDMDTADLFERCRAGEVA